MSGELYAIAGSKIFIGDRVSAKGTVSASDFAGASWTEIGGWANAGAIGDTQEVIEQTLINENRVRKIKGTLNGGTLENQFVPMALDAGQIKFKQAISECVPYQFKVEFGANCTPESVVTISAATPGVVTWNNHGLLLNQPVVFSNTGGALPTGLTAGTIYYVISGGLTTNSFSVSATKGGTGVATTGGTGVHTASAPPVGMTDMFYGLALPGARQGGDANAVHLRSWSIAIDSNIIEV